MQLMGPHCYSEKKCWLAIGGYDEKKKNEKKETEDWDFYIRVC
jgi:hypothetical protein